MSRMAVSLGIRGFMGTFLLEDLLGDHMIRLKSREEPNELLELLRVQRANER